MRPTARDLAKAAGVSLATVDRVLNDRPNVSRKAARQVNEAIERIGFVRNLAAVNLARSTNYRFRFLLPQAGDQYLREIMHEISAVNDALKSEMVSAEIVQIPIEDPYLVANHLASLDAAKVEGVAIMAPESPQVRDALNRLVERGIHVVRLLSGVEQTAGIDFVGIDNYAAGATAARLVGRFCRKERGSVMVIAETMRAQDSIERRLGFDDVINEAFPHLNVLPSLETHADKERTRRIVTRMLEYNRNVTALYVLSSEARVPITCVAEFVSLDDIVVVAHERTPFSVAALKSGEIDAIIAQNPGHAVRSAVRLLRARTDNREALKSQDQLRIEILLKDNL
jgi:LacI family transcriptional regulator